MSFCPWASYWWNRLKCTSAAALPLSCSLAEIHSLLFFFFFFDFLSFCHWYPVFNFCPTFHNSWGCGTCEGIPGSCGILPVPWAWNLEEFQKNSPFRAGVLLLRVTLHGFPSPATVRSRVLPGILDFSVDLAASCPSFFFLIGMVLSGVYDYLSLLILLI